MGSEMCIRDRVYLKRLTMGPLMLDPVLERGEWRPLSAEEVAALRQA